MSSGKKQKYVVVTVEGGCVQNVKTPEGVTVFVRDYDQDGTETRLLSYDKNGDAYVVTRWDHQP